MKDSKKKTTVIFLHFPKTAGSTLNSLIYREYKKKDIFGLIATRSFTEILEKINVRIKNQGGISLIKGHMGFGLHEFLPQPSTYVTFLRHPIERTISLYYYLKQFEPSRFSDTEAVVELAHHQSLENFCLQLRDNPMTRFFSGTDLKTQVGMETFWSLDNMWLLGVDIPNYEQCSPEMLELAKNNLKQHFSVIGVTERFDESLILFKKELGWKNIYYTVRNATSKKLKKDSIPQDTLARIKAHNQLDLELYQYAQELFEEQIARYPGSFEKDLKRFRSLNPTLGKLYAKAEFIQISAKESLEFSKRFVKALLPKFICSSLRKFV